MKHSDAMLILGWVAAGFLHLMIVAVAFWESCRWGFLVLLLPLASLAFMARMPKTVLPLVVGQMLALTLTWPAMALREENARTAAMTEEWKDELDPETREKAREKRIRGKAMMQELMQRLDAREFLLGERSKSLRETSAVVAAWHGLMNQTLRLSPVLEIPAARLQSEAAAYSMLHAFTQREQAAIASEYERLASGRIDEPIELPEQSAAR